MPLKYTYLLVDMACIAVPLLASFHPRTRFYKQWMAFLLPCLITAIFFLVWDSIFTRAGIWRFNSDYITGIYLFNLPAEEVLFFICIPYASTFTYYCIKLFAPLPTRSKGLRIATYAMAGALLVIAVIYHNKFYTSVTFALLAFFLSYIAGSKTFYAAASYLSFLIILLPFTLSNGLLTGSFTQAPVVLYNEQYNLGLRILTIPVEDIFYAMLLLFMNIYGFELMSKIAAERKEPQRRYI